MLEESKDIDVSMEQPHDEIEKNEETEAKVEENFGNVKEEEEEEEEIDEEEIDEEVDNEVGQMKNESDIEMKNESDEEIDINDPFKPTTIVLAKVKGYPAWPAMVLKESILPENIKRKKPKKSIKKKPTRFLPVRFFSDDTYIWMNELDIKLLTDDMIQEYFNVASKKRRRDNLLENAYQLAIDPPDMDLFVRYGSRAEPPEEQELDQLLAPIIEPESESEKPPATKKKRGRKPKQDSLANLRLLKKQENLKQIEERKRLEARLLAEYDDDWGIEGVDGYDKLAGNYIFEDDKQQKKLVNVNSEELINKLTKYQADFQNIYTKLMNLLIDRQEEKIDEPSVLKQLDLLENLLKQNDFPKTILIKSKMLRLLILTSRKPIEQFPSLTIKNKTNKILKNSLDLSVKMNTMDDLKEKEETEEETEKQEMEKQETEQEQDIEKQPNEEDKGKEETEENSKIEEPKEKEENEEEKEEAEDETLDEQIGKDNLGQEITENNIGNEVNGKIANGDSNDHTHG